MTTPPHPMTVTVIQDDTDPNKRFQVKVSGSGQIVFSCSRQGDVVSWLAVQGYQNLQPSTLGDWKQAG